MALASACPECGVKLKVSEAHAGRHIDCPDCGTPVPIDGPEPDGSGEFDRYDYDDRPKRVRRPVSPRDEPEESAGSGWFIVRLTILICILAVMLVLLYEKFF